MYFYGTVVYIDTLNQSLCINFFHSNHKKPQTARINLQALSLNKKQNPYSFFREISKIKIWLFDRSLAISEKISIYLHDLFLK